MGVDNKKIFGVFSITILIGCLIFVETSNKLTYDKYKDAQFGISSDTVFNGRIMAIKISYKEDNVIYDLTNYLDIPVLNITFYPDFIYDAGLTNDGTFFYIMTLANITKTNCIIDINKAVYDDVSQSIYVIKTYQIFVKIDKNVVNTSLVYDPLLDLTSDYNGNLFAISNFNGDIVKLDLKKQSILPLNVSKDFPSENIIGLNYINHMFYLNLLKYKSVGDGFTILPGSILDIYNLNTRRIEQSFSIDFQFNHVLLKDKQIIGLDLETKSYYYALNLRYYPFIVKIGLTALIALAPDLYIIRKEVI